MSNVDVVARLQLRAEQFSSETGQRFAEMKTRARSAAEEVRASFTSSFAEVQRLASQSLAIRRNSSGALDLSGEIASLQQSAAAADRKSEALRQMAVAAHSAASAVNIDAQALRLEADAAAVASLSEEKNAAAIRQRILALEAMQVELNKTTMATVVHADAGRRVVASSGQQRAAMQQLSFQLNDIALGFAAGTPPQIIFAQQSSQVVQALQMMNTSTTGVLGLLAGPWGAALTAAAVVATPFVAKLFESNRALDDSIAKLRKDAEETQNTTRAKQIFATTLNGVEAALRENEKALADQATAYRGVAEKAELAARAQIRSLDAVRAGMAANLEAQREQLKQDLRDARRGTPDANRAYRLENLPAAIADREARLQRLDQDLATANDQLNRSRLDQVVSVAQMSAVERINRGYDDAVRKARQRADIEHLTAEQLKRQVDAINSRRTVALKEEQDRQAAERRKPRTVALGDQLENEQGQRLLSSAQGYSGLSERTAAGNSSLRALFREANINVDPKMVAWCAAFVNSVLAANGLPGTGSLSAKSFLGYGSATDKPVKGDIVVLRRGNGGQGHVGFFDSTDARGNVRVTGGNQGDAVSTQTFARRDVLGFRRAPTAADAYADEIKAANEADQQRKRAAAELESSLKSLTAAFDPAQQALDKYLTSLIQISEGVAAGKLSPERADAYARSARVELNDTQARLADQSLRKAIGPEEFAAGLQEYEAAVRSANDNWVRRQDEFLDRAQIAGEAFRNAVESTAELFGARISGPLRLLLAPGGIGGQSTLLAKDISTTLKSVGINLSEKSLKGLSDAISGAAYGQIGGSIFASISGGKDNRVASGIGGVLGEVAGKQLGPAISKAVGGSLGKALGGAAGPIGSIVGGILGNVVGNLFTKAPKASAGVTVNQYGSVQAGAATGTNAQATSGASTMAGAVASGLNRIAELLGAKITGATDVQIGIYKDMIRVNDHGGAIGGVTGSGALTFQSEEAAIAYAISDALKDGVLTGISDASLKILRSGQDLDRAITKAILIEGIPKALRAATDPVGAAIDAVNDKFQKMVDALTEGGATAEQMAQAQQMYNIELEQAKNTTPSASASLKEFLNSLKVGSASPLSLRSQEATAMAALRPFFDQIDAGKAIDQSKYQSAAQAFLDVERQLYGSSKAYFDAFDQVQAATAKAISTIDNATPITPGMPDPFTKATADAAAKTAANTQTGNEMSAETNALLERLVQATEALALKGSAVDVEFMGTLRGFGQAA